ncbi:MAG: cation diffusion facilitator family transporter [Thermoflexibacter sp.]|nr:cation diffusion facilitator family transporter [Thermoflexibacter sp.]
MEAQQQNIATQRIVVFTGFILLIAKFLAYFLTKSNAILTDALESIVNVIAGIFALYSLFVAARPKDSNHPYGHGKIEYISASIEGILIFIAGISMISKATYNLFYPTAIEKLDIGILLTTVAGIINYLLGALIEKRGQETHSLTLIADGKHLKSDAYSTVGMIIGLAIIYFTGYAWLDNIIAISFGLLICYTGISILKKSISGIMDEADYEIIAEIINVLNTNRKDNWVDFHHVRVIKFGSRFHIDCHITLPYYISVKDAHEEIEQVEILMKQHFENQVETSVHSDPCKFDFCSICLKQDCKVRQFPFAKRIEWNIENTMPDRKKAT